MWDELPEDIKVELSDEKFADRKHHSRATYADGCRGPLCRKAERDRGRVRPKPPSKSGFRRKGREWMEDLPNIDAILEWHFEEVAKRKEAKKKKEVAA